MSGSAASSSFGDLIPSPPLVGPPVMATRRRTEMGESEGRERTTHQSSGKVFEVNAQCCLDCSSSWHDRAALQCPLDHAQRVVKGALHLIEKVVYYADRSESASATRDDWTADDDSPLAPRRMIELELTTLVPFTRMSSSSEILSCTTSSAVPRLLASNVSSPSKLAKLDTMVAPVALAIRRRSSFLQRRTAMAPASTNSFKHRSSIPFVVRMTLAPAARILRMRSMVMSDSLLGRDDRQSCSEERGLDSAQARVLPPSSH